MDRPSQEFIQANVLRELSSLAEDVLQPYVFSDPWMDHVYDYDTRHLYRNSLTAKKILIQAMLGHQNTIHRLHILSHKTQVTLFVCGMIDNQGLVTLGDLGPIKPQKSLIFEPIYTDQEIDLIRKCFSFLWYAYERQDRLNLFDTKAIFKMNGFHALFTEPKNAEEEAIAIANRDRVVENLQGILEGQAGIIDAQDSFGLIAGDTDRAQSHRIIVDQIYMEIARILKIPATRLVGRSPQGMNATGVGDALNYDMTLDGIRSGWLEPFLDQMGIQYNKVDKIDISYLKSVLEMHTMMGLEPEPELCEKIRLLGKKL